MLSAPASTDLARFERELHSAGESARYWRLNFLEAVWRGKRYEIEGRASWWDNSVPLQERAPCIVYPLARAAGERLVSFVFGEGRFPRMTVADQDATVPGLALDDEDAAAVTALVATVMDQARLPSVLRAGLIEGLRCGTACFVSSLRRGCVHVEIIPAKWCTPTFDPHDPNRVTSLIVQYLYEEPDPATGRPVPFVYRRTIDATADIRYEPVRADVLARSKGAAWREAERVPVEFCAVDWVRNLPEPAEASAIDGVALHDGLEDEIEALDFALSQRHRNARYNGEPQLVILGGRKALQADSGQAAAPPASSSWGARFVDSAGKFLGIAGARSQIKKAPDKVWFLESESGSSVDAKLLESSGAGGELLSKDAEDLRAKLLDAMGVMLVDPKDLGTGDMSARALTLLYAPMLAHCDALRECWGDALMRVVDTCLRLLVTDVARRDGVHLAGYREARPILERFLARTGDESAAEVRWFALPLRLAWGPYFQPSASDRQQDVTWARQAIGDRPLLSRADALSLIAPTLGIDDVETACEHAMADEGAGQSALTETMRALGSEADTPTAPPAEQPEFYQYDYEAGVCTYNEARARKGLTPVDSGDVPIAVYMARFTALIEGAKARAVTRAEGE